MKGEEEDKSKTLNLGGQIVNLNHCRSHCSDGLVVRKINIIIITTASTTITHTTMWLNSYMAILGIFKKTNYKTQTISLVSKRFKLISFITIRVQWTRFRKN